MDDYYELLAYLANKFNPNDYCLEDELDLEDFLYDRYQINFEEFSKMINDLLPLCSIAESPLSNKIYQGFGTDKHWLIKQEIK